MSLFRFVLTSDEHTKFSAYCDVRQILRAQYRSVALTLVNDSHVRDLTVIRWKVEGSGDVNVYV